MAIATHSQNTRNGLAILYGSGGKHGLLEKRRFELTPAEQAREYLAACVIKQIDFGCSPRVIACIEALEQGGPIEGAFTEIINEVCQRGDFVLIKGDLDRLYYVDNSVGHISGEKLEPLLASARHCISSYPISGQIVYRAK